MIHPVHTSITNAGPECTAPMRGSTSPTSDTAGPSGVQQIPAEKDDHVIALSCSIASAPLIRDLLIREERTTALVWEDGSTTDPVH